MVQGSWLLVVNGSKSNFGSWFMVQGLILVHGSWFRVKG